MTVRRRTTLVMAAFLMAHAALLLYGSWVHFVVVDEAGHIPAGISHWRRGTFEAYRVNPPLCRMIAVLPALAAHPAGSFDRLTDTADDRPEWLLGLDFMRANWSRYLDLIRLARLPGILISVLGGWLVGHWARQLYGDLAGCVATALWCFDPMVCAFAQVVTPDVPAAVAGLAATYAFCAYLKAPSPGRMLTAGLLLGIAELTKFTLLVLYPVWPLLLAIVKGRGANRGPRWGQFFAMCLVSLAVINIGYGFRGACRPLGEITLFSRLLGGESGAASSEGTDRLPNRFSKTWIAALPAPVPQDFLVGIDLQQRDFEGALPSYLRGTWRHRGWWYYYLYALAVKVPLGSLVLIAVAVASTLRTGVRNLTTDEYALLLPAATILAVVSMQTGFNHHTRYVLPAMPFLMILSGRTVAYARARAGWFRGVVLAMAAWSIASGLMAQPHAMSYFNELAGGPSNGHNHLVDSNVDWGQDLLFLRDWMAEHPEATPIHLAYYHFIDPQVVGIQFSLPPPGPNGLFPRDREFLLRRGPHPGYYAVSVNHLRGSTFVAPDGQGGFRHAVRGDFEYFRLFRPVATAGHSIYIYRITLQEANAVRGRCGLPQLECRGK